uniref:ubiquitinyl hydrolase 1 n=1 Tax=Henneguya salminicola TaxID=69463 RepID=A0A6G3MF43_HENSL
MVLFHLYSEHDPNDNICDSSYPFKYANHFLADFTNLYTINFYEVSSDCEEPSFVLNVSKKMKINNLLNCAAVRCGDVDPSFIKIFKTRIVYNPNSYVFEKTYQETLLNFFTQLNRTSDRQRLFYQVLKVPAHEVDNKIMFNVDFLNKYNDEKSVTVFFHPNDKSYSDFMTAFEESLLIYGINNHNPLRVVNCENCALTIIDPDSNMEIYYEDIYFKRIRVEEIPDNQMNLHGTERLITVNITFSGNQNVSFHKSFFIKISPNFTFQDIVSIIEKKNIKNIVKYLFFHIHEHIFHSFPSDLKQNIPSHQLLTNLFNGKENENYIIDNATIVVEVLQRVEQSRRSMKYDPSIKIRS